MSNKQYPQLKNPPQPPVQVTVSGTATSLQTLMSLSSNAGNYGGFQIKTRSDQSDSVFWGTTSAVTVSNGDEIPPGTAQIIPASVCPDASLCYLVAAGSTVACVVFIGG
jgi:hypothetical protein